MFFFILYKSCNYSRQFLCADGFELWSAADASQFIPNVRGKICPRMIFDVFTGRMILERFGTQNKKHSSLKTVRFLSYLFSRHKVTVTRSWWFSEKDTKMSILSIIWWSHLVSNSDSLSITGYRFEATMVSILKFWAPRRSRIILKTSEIHSFVNFTARYELCHIRGAPERETLGTEGLAAIWTSFVEYK